MAIWTAVFMIKSIPLALNLLKSTAFPRCTRPVSRTKYLRSFLSFLQLEHTTMSWLSTYAFFWNLISHLNIVLQTLLLLFVISMNCLYRERSWFPLMLKVCLQTYPWRSVSTWRLTTSPRATLISG